MLGLEDGRHGTGSMTMTGTTTRLPGITADILMGMAHPMVMGMRLMDMDTPLMVIPTVVIPMLPNRHTHKPNNRHNRRNLPKTSPVADRKDNYQARHIAGPVLDRARGFGS
ncbi:hypothetical protein TBH_C0793 [Thiolapillus brandeum]|uniref:Uncharacterized protein n=1 Tax=Thiolapillus brandeum TaxID=1076588 RepID=A0A7U6GHH8_9GAMM|nr:hypothetical protein TBH_C0793 [Thiolapillus brandeum]